MARPDVLIAGGGPAGAAAAITLARGGAEVTLVERSRGPHDKVCGEFLSGEAVALLRRLGLDPAALGGVPIDRLGIARGREIRDIPLPFPATSLSRSCMDEELLALAADAGAVVRRGVVVREAIAGPRPRLRLDGGEMLEAGALFVATGKHDLPGLRRPDGVHPGLVGLKWRLRLIPERLAEMQGRVELLGLPGGYAGLQPSAGGEAGLGLLLPRETVAATRVWDGLASFLRRVSPRLEVCLDGAEPVGARGLAIGRIPYGFLRRQGQGFWWLGDQAAVIPSFAGEGVALALWSGVGAAEAFLAGRSAEAFQAGLAEALALRVGGAALLSRLMVRPWFQRIAAPVVTTFPGLAGWAALCTRLPARTGGH